MLARLRAAHRGPIVAVGVSLGGNALLRWAEEAGDTAAQTAGAVCAISSPVDLAAGGAAIGRGFNRVVYTRMFLRTMKPKALAKLQQHPGLFDRDRLIALAHAVRVRQRLYRALARLPRHRRLLEARLGQATPCAHLRPGTGAQCAQRSLRSGRQPATTGRGRPFRDPVAAAAGRACRIPRRPLASRASHDPAGKSDGLAAPAHLREHRPMDDIVKAALQKWPNVPAAYGWLALDTRGDWYLRDEVVQAAGRFPAVKGSRIEHDKLKEFIHRNYESDDRGCWFFQNGPQRVHVELEAAPFVWRMSTGADGDASRAKPHRVRRSRRIELARRGWQAFPPDRPGTGPGAHARHGGRVPDGRFGPLVTHRASLRRAAEAVRLCAQSAGHVSGSRPFSSSFAERCRG